MQTAPQMLARPARIDPRDRAASLFQDDWQIYRKVVSENYFFHREAYAVLREVLAEEVARPFRFLDVACGDASESVRALAGTRVFHYHGVDLSEPALDLARDALRALPCPATLERREFAEALRSRSIPVDVAWIGLSLHHFRTAEKRALMWDLRVMLGADGKLLVYEPSGPDRDTRAAWLRRWDRQRTTWRALTPEEWRSLRDHSHANDYPEAHVTWLALGYEAGFGRARCLYESPTQLFRLYCFDS